MKIFNLCKYAVAALAVSAATNVFAVETVSLTATLTPNPIPKGYTGEIRLIPMMDGEFAEQNDNYGKTLSVLNASTNVVLGYAHLTPKSDGVTMDPYYSIVITNKSGKDLILQEGVDYAIGVSKGYFYKVNEEGERTIENVYTRIPFTIGEALPEVPDTGFQPTSILPTSIDPSESDWTINLNFSEKITLNPDKIAYLECGSEKYEADTYVLNTFTSSTPKSIIIGFDGMKMRPNGTYTLVLPEGAVSYADGRTNDRYTYKYSWTGYNPGTVGPIDELKIVSAKIGDIDIMQPGQVVPNIAPEGCYFTADVFPAAIQAVDVRILDVTDLEESDYANGVAVWSNAIESKNSEGLFTKEIYSIEGIKLYEGHTYTAELKLYDLYQLPDTSVAGTLYTDTFTGTTETFKYSPVEIVSIEPAPGSVFEIGQKMVVTFSAGVNLVAGEGKSGFGKGNAGWANFSSISSNADKTVWTIGFPNSEINAAAGPGQICPRLWGTDEQGLQLRPSEYDIPEGESEEGYNVFNGGTEESSYTQVNYAGYAKCPKVVVAPLMTEELSYIDFSIAGDKELNPSYLVAFPELKDANGETVAKLLGDDFEVTSSTGTEEDMKVTGIRVPLDNVITTPGIYTLELEWNLFVVGSQFDSFASAPGTYEIVVEKETTIPEDIQFSSDLADNINAEFFPADEEEGTPATYLVTFESAAETVNITLAIPEGYDAMYYVEMVNVYGLKKIKGEEAEDEGWTKGNVLTVKTDGQSYKYAVALSKDNEVDVDNAFVVSLKADTTVGVEVLDAESAAEYYTVEGIKVANPEKGLYIKVTEGKAKKVIL